MRTIAIVACCVLAGCSNNSSPSMLKSVWKQDKAAREDKPPATKKTPPRAEIDRLNVAMIQMNLDGEDVWPIMVPASRNGANVTYSTQLRQSVTLNESQIVATRGLGADLIAAKSGPNDPLHRLTPPGNWPDNVSRTYRVGGDGPAGQELHFDCQLKRAGANTITLAGTPIAVVGFVEDCAGETGAFRNLYAADATTGRVWQSQQFAGYDIAPINLEILEPLTE